MPGIIRYGIFRRKMPYPVDFGTFRFSQNAIKPSIILCNSALYCDWIATGTVRNPYVAENQRSLAFIRKMPRITGIWHFPPENAKSLVCLAFSE